jgi:hypothetical protein
VTVISRAQRRPARLLAVLALTAPLAGTLVLSTAAPALASQTTSVTLDGASDGDVLTSAKDVTAVGTIRNTGSTTSGGTLVLDGPTNANGDAFHTTTGISGCNVPALSSSCSKSASAVFSASQMSQRRNGHWIATVNNASTKSFYTNFRPTADPSNLAAAPSGRTRVDLSWSYSGTELDKAGFEVTETHNGSSRTLGVPTSACSGSSCGYSIDYAEPGIGATESYTYTVTALRTSGGCSSCGDYTRSGPSSSAGAQLVGPPPPPSPTPSPTGGTGTTGGTTGTTTGGTTGSTGGTTSGGTTGGTTGGTSGGSTSTTTGGSTSGTTTGSHSAGKPVVIPTLPPVVASRRAFALGFNKFSPSLGIPKLPPLPAIETPITAPGNDTYQPTLPYSGESKKTTHVLTAPISAITTNLDTVQLAKMLAIALLLLVSAAHVRLFLSAQDDD